MVRKMEITLIAAVLLTAGIAPALLLSPAHAEPTTAFYGYVIDYETDEPIEDASIMVMGEIYGRVGHTDEDGYYYYEVDKGGEYTLITQKEGYYDEMKEKSIIMGQEVQVDFQLVPYKSQVSGRVTDEETGSGIPEAMVEYGNDQIRTHGWTDEDGYYEIGIEPGTYDVRVHAVNYMPYRDEGIVLEEGSNENFDYQLDPFDQGVFGYVFDEDGNAVEGADIQLNGQGRTSYCTTDEEGYYEILLREGAYKVSVYKSGYSVTKGSVEVEEGQMTEEDWTLYEEAHMSIIMRLVRLILKLLGF